MTQIYLRNFIALVLVTSILPIENQSQAQTVSNKPVSKPKLVVIIVVDQFRADYFTRFKSQFKSGYKRLLEQSAYFPFAEYDLLQCMTAPGHSVISTGAYPYQMGINLNRWWNRKDSKMEYSVEDANHPLIDATNPSYKGFSPKNLIGTTLGDELKSAVIPSKEKDPSQSPKVVSISLKDRSAILLGGKRADLALWFENASFKWSTTDYYLPEKKLPDWVLELNNGLKKQNGNEYVWEVKEKFKYQVLLGAPSQDGNKDGSKDGNKDTKKNSYKDALRYPFGLKITTDAALAALKPFKLGQDSNPDILAVSYSTHDYLGHTYGPNSNELEELTKSEDLEIGRLIDGVARHSAGSLNEVLFVFTADHGVAPEPVWANASKIPSKILAGKDLVSKIENGLTEKYGKPPGDNSTWVLTHLDFNFYLNTHAIQNKKLDLDSVLSDTKNILLTLPEIAYVFTKTEYEKRLFPPGKFFGLVEKSYVRDRSGDVVAIPKPFYFTGGDNVSHMTSYAYDRMVPVLFMGKRFKPGTYSDKANVADIASTLSFVLGTLPPPHSEGKILNQAFR
jgi:predicted AlkP superfamily pyrophosphatase or phosphodiesterase